MCIRDRFGVLLYSIQLYYDFSAYSDMAIGLGRMFGFHYHTKFNYPYLAKSVTDYWRRWHISLGSFLDVYKRQVRYCKRAV